MLFFIYDHGLVPRRLYHISLTFSFIYLNKLWNILLWWALEIRRILARAPDVNLIFNSDLSLRILIILFYLRLRNTIRLLTSPWLLRQSTILISTFVHSIIWSQIYFFWSFLPTNRAHSASWIHTATQGADEGVFKMLFICSVVACLWWLLLIYVQHDSRAVLTSVNIWNLSLVEFISGLTLSFNY